MDVLTAQGRFQIQLPTSVYSAWLKHHFKEQPTRLLLESRTFIFDPLRPYGCGKTLARAPVSWRLLRALHDLGEAEYPS